MASKPTRWGILSSGKICQDFTTAIQTLPEEEHQVVAIAARDVSDAKAFAERFGIHKAYGSYSELAKDEDVEIIYIGNIHPFHCETTKLMLNSDKHVLCEKPLAMNYKEVKEMIDLAKEKDLFFAEGIWSRYFPVYDHLRKDLAAELYGKAQFLSVDFGAPMWSIIPNIKDNHTGGGCLYTFGVYPIQLALLLFKEEPERIEANALMQNDVDKYLSVTLHFSKERITQFNMHLNSVLNNTAFISFEKGMVQMPDFWVPHELITPENKYNFPVPKTDKPFNLSHSAGFIYQIQGVRRALLNGEKESKFFTHSDSITTIKIMDEIRKQIKMVVEADTK